MRPASNLLGVVGLLVCSATLVCGQGTGTLHGIVADPSNLPIAGASVTATLAGRGLSRAVQTSERGEYVIPVLPVGQYTILAEAQGFKQFRREGVTLTANESVRADVKLEVGDVAEKILVTAEATHVDTRSTTVGTLVDSRRVVELPINGRNIVALAAMLPGVGEVKAPQTFTGFGGGPTVAVAGSRPNQNLFLLDGAHFNDLFRNTGLNYPPPDALQEVKVLTNSFSAEYGRNAGAIFNVVTRSGTNSFHGAAWEFWRNQALNARNFFAPARKPHLNQNQFGGGAGGPIRKDRLFFFGSYEGLLIRPEALSTSAFPLTEAERRGDFTASRAAIRDPSTGQPFPNRQIPASRFDTVAANLISRNLMPLPNRPDGQLVELSPSPKDNNQVLVRLDYNRARHTIDGRYNYNLATALDSAGGQSFEYLPRAARNKSQNVSIGDTFVLKPNLLNQARASYNRLYAKSVALKPFSLSDLGANFPEFAMKLPPNLIVSGRITLGADSPVAPRVVSESIMLHDSVSWTAGNHTVKAGFEFMKTRFVNYTIVRTMGVFNFSGQITGDSAADFLIGRATSMLVASPMREQSANQTGTYSFFQDDWRIHPRLTLNLGLRYELPLPWYHPNDFWGTLIPGRQSQVIPNAPLGLLFPGDPGIPRGLIQTDKNNWAPRFGFAWDPFGRGRTSVRGAYGIFYETMNADIIQNEGQPFLYNFTIPTPFSLTDPLRGQPPIPLTTNLKNPTFVGLQEISYPDPDMRTGYMQHFNLNVQHEVVRDLVVQLGYVGKLGRKLMLALPSNPAIYAPGATLANINQRRILQPGFGNNRIISASAPSAYHSLQTEVNKRFARGFSVQAAYTFSRSIDIKSGITASLNVAVPNPLDFKSDRGLSDFHAKHIAAVTWIWDVPNPSLSNPVLRTVVHGWQVNGLVSLRSGMALNVLSGRDDALSGTTVQRPNVIGDHRLSEDRSRGEKILAWYNRTAFAFPSQGTYGNVGRNALIGPAMANTNLGLFKNFTLPGREGLRLQFRSEYFNLLNSVNLSSPESRLSAGVQMGRITSADSARVIQFAMKVLF